MPLATASAAKLGSPGIPVAVAEGVTAVFSTATDAAGNASACSVPISYTRLKVSSLACVVPKLKGESLRSAKIGAQGGSLQRRQNAQAKTQEGRELGPLVVKSSEPSAGKTLEVGSKVPEARPETPKSAPLAVRRTF